MQQPDPSQKIQSTPSQSFPIVPLTSSEQMIAVVQVQRAAWGMDDLTVIPPHLLTAVSKNGGMVLGAYSDDRLVGFILGLVSRNESDGEVYLTTHMVGVMPEYQSHDIGFALYQAQAHWAKHNQIRFIRWTYDPMETRNANLYIRKLGGRVVQFIPDYYGRGVGSTLQKGLPTDRFLVEWDSYAECCENSPLEENDLILVSPQCPPSRFDKVTLEDCRAAQIRVPLNFQELKTQDFQRALEWQNAVRTACSALFDDDAIWVSGFHVNQEASLGIYVVTKRGDAKK